MTKRQNGDDRVGWAAAARSLLITAGLCLIAAELGAAIFLFATEGRLPWLAPNSQKASAVTEVPKLSDGWLRLSPHCGQIGLPGLHLSELMTREGFESLFGHRMTEQSYNVLGFNNEGFVSLRDYPFEDASGEAFIIGLFGSSVSSGFANSMEGAMNDLLNRDPRLAHRKVVLLNFGNSATKQPQNAACLAYFLSIGQRFDYVVNMDGFPEAFIGWLNAHQYATDELMPYAGMIFGIQNAMFVGAERLARLHERLNELQTQRRSPDFALHALWVKIRLKALNRELSDLEKTLTTTTAKAARNYAMPLRPRSSVDDAAIRDKIVSAWFNGSVAMAGMTKALHVPYLHILLPNQYFTKAHFTDEERARLLNLTQAPVQSLVPEYFQRFSMRGLELSQRGVDFLDATNLFDDQDGSVFYDNCCHFTEKGNLMLAHALAERILRGLGHFDAH